MSQYFVNIFIAAPKIVNLLCLNGQFVDMRALNRCYAGGLLLCLQIAQLTLINTLFSLL